MGNKYRFSIIIPVYNTEEYLQECITSVLGQNFANYEIILVNDGSTDRSPEKCDEYAAKYANISVIHQKNKGPSAARNKGVQCAQGEYLLFLDSDDRYCNTELLHKIDICAEDSDIVAFNHIEAPDYEAVCKVQKGTKKFNTEHKNGKEFLRDALEQDYLYPWYPCKYAYRREYWIKKGYSFPEKRVYEDVFLTWRVILGAGKCKAIPEIGYYYRTERENSITKNIKYSSLSDLLESISKNIEDIVKMDVSTELKGMLCNNFSCLYYAILIQSNCLQNKKEKELLWKNLDEKKWICKYTIEKKQKAVRMIMNWVGIPAAARLLNVRRILKNII